MMLIKCTVYLLILLILYDGLIDFILILSGANTFFFNFYQINITCNINYYFILCGFFIYIIKVYKDKNLNVN
jgi:hypothetical protein